MYVSLISGVIYIAYETQAWNAKFNGAHANVND